MNTKTGYSKILQIEKDLRFSKKAKKLNKKHFDSGKSINLKYDEGQNEYANQYAAVNFVSGDESYPSDSMQFASDDYLVDSFGTAISDNGNETTDERYATQKEEEEDEEDKYNVTTVSSGTSEDGTPYIHRSTESYEDEIAYKERPGGEYSAESAFNEDIKAILAGQKVYNEEQKQLVASKAQNFDDSGNSDDYSTQSSTINDSHNNGLRNQDFY